MKKSIILLPIAMLTLTSCFNSYEANKVDNKTWTWSTVSSTANSWVTVGKTQTAQVSVNELMKDDSNKRLNSFNDWDVVDAFGWKKQWNDILNEDARLKYYYSMTCNHCQTLNTVFESSKTYDQFAFEKKEVIANQANYNELLELVVKLNMDKEKLAVPFIYDEVTGEVYQWNEQIIDFINKEMSKWDWNFARKKSDKEKFAKEVTSTWAIEQKEITHWEETKNTSTDTKWKTSKE